MITRKVTGNTDNTKADSVIKTSERGYRGAMKSNRMFELESFPSGNIFLTKSEEHDSRSKTKEKMPIDLDNFKIVPNLGTNSSYNRVGSEHASKETSELENSELKQTADFFRPSPRLKDTPKNKLKKITPKNYNIKMKKIDWGAKVK